MTGPGKEADMAEARPRFESSDMNVRAVAITALALLAFLALAPILLAVLYSSATGDVDRRLTIRPPQPELQLSPPADLAALRAAERQRLESYGWVDRGKGIVHIPIEQAMQAVARQGIPDFQRPPP